MDQSPGRRETARTVSGCENGSFHQAMGWIAAGPMRERIVSGQCFRCMDDSIQAAPKQANARNQRFVQQVSTRIKKVFSAKMGAIYAVSVKLLTDNIFKEDRFTVRKPRSEKCAMK